MTSKLERVKFFNSLSPEDQEKLKEAKKRSNKRKAMDLAAEMCGLKKVRGCVSGKIYYE